MKKIEPITYDQLVLEEIRRRDDQIKYLKSELKLVIIASIIIQSGLLIYLKNGC